MKKNLVERFPVIGNNASDNHSRSLTGDDLIYSEDGVVWHDSRGREIERPIGDRFSHSGDTVLFYKRGESLFAQIERRTYKFPEKYPISGTNRPDLYPIFWDKEIDRGIFKPDGVEFLIGLGFKRSELRQSLW